MKKLNNVLLTFSLLSAMAATTALAQPYPGGTWTFDEFGSGLFGNGTIVGYANGTTRVDPVSGMATLYYFWNVPTAPGDVLVHELGAPTNQFSDVLRFDGQGGMYFFSESEAGTINPDPADVPVLPFGQPGAVALFESGPEGNNGVFYTPTPGQPGFDTSGIFPGVSYHFISDIVPEPGSGALLLIGAGIVGFRMRCGRR